MSPLDYDSLRGDKPYDPAGDVPPDGDHEATLDRAAVVEARGVEKLVTEWSNEQYTWQTWNPLDPTASDGWKYPDTLALIDGLGIDRSKLTADENPIEDALAACEGNRYKVRTESREGQQGGRWFTSTFIDETVGPDVPIDNDDLPDPEPQEPEQEEKEPERVPRLGEAIDVEDDEDIPF